MLLSGGSINQARYICGLSRKEAYRCVNHFMDDVLLSPVLDINLPKTTCEWDVVKRQPYW